LPTKAPGKARRRLLCLDSLIEYSSSFRDFCPLGKIKIIGLFLLCGVLKRRCFGLALKLEISYNRVIIS
jgi:hypothetical protein